jgi:hypothetical protein
MAETVTCAAAARLQISEVADAADFPGAEDTSDRTVTHNSYDYSGTLKTGTAPDPEAVFSKAYTGTTTIDLQAAPKTGGSTQDLTGKKLVAYIFEALAANTGNVTISAGATNGYDIKGDLTLTPGERRVMLIESGKASTYDAVAAADSEIDIVAGSDTINVTMVFGGT